jgi:type III secretion translocon protein HrpF
MTRLGPLLELERQWQALQETQENLATMQVLAALTTLTPQALQQLQQVQMPQLAPPEPKRKPGEPGGLTAEQMDVMSTMMRHQDRLKGPLTRESVQKTLDAEDTPPDLHDALKKLQADDGFISRLDVQLKGKRGFKEDGKFHMDSIRDLAKKDGEFKTFLDNKAKGFTEAYVPSDAADQKQTPRAMTSNDAMRELYLYSDNLPGKVTIETLEAIVNGTHKGGKLPPQVIAAAKHFVDRKDEWEGTMGRVVKRGEMCNRVAQNLQLEQRHSDAITALRNDSKFFFGSGSCSRDQLQKWIDDPSVSKERKAICETLLNDAVLYGMLDNAKGGHSGGGWASRYKADDGKISLSDVEILDKRLKPEQRVPPAPGESKPDSMNTQAAIEMRAGWLDDPNTKTAKGNNGLFKLVDDVLKYGKHVLDGLSTACSALTKVPLVGVLFGAAAVGWGALGASAGVVREAVKGGDMGNAWRNFGLDMAGTVLSTVTAPGAGKALSAGLKAGAKEGLEHGAETMATREFKKEVSKAAAKATADEFSKIGEQAVADSRQLRAGTQTPSMNDVQRLQASQGVHQELWIG